MSNASNLCRDGFFGNLYIKGRKVVDSSGNGNFKSIRTNTLEYDNELVVNKNTSIKLNPSNKVESYFKLGRASAPGAGVQLVPIKNKGNKECMVLEPGEIVTGFVCSGNNVGPVGLEHYIKIIGTTDKTQDTSQDIIQGDKVFETYGSRTDLFFEDWNCGFWGSPDDKMTCTALSTEPTYVVAEIDTNTSGAEWLTGTIEIKLHIVKIPLAQLP